MMYGIFQLDSKQITCSDCEITKGVAEGGMTSIQAANDSKLRPNLSQVLARRIKLANDVNLLKPITSAQWKSGFQKATKKSLINLMRFLSRITTHGC